MSARVVITAVTDVTEAVLEDAEQVLDWFDGESRIDWERFIDKLADTYGAQADPPYDFEEYDNPAVRKIQRHVRDLRRAMQ